MKYTINIGISKPDLGGGRQEQHLSIQEMRALIYRTAHCDSALIRNCLYRSEQEGLTGEDTMTLIAYQALRQLEDVYQRHVDTMMRQPVPPVIVPEKKL